MISLQNEWMLLMMMMALVFSQNRVDKYYYYIRLRMEPPESVSFIPVAYSVCKRCCGKLMRRSSKNKMKKPAAVLGPLQSQSTGPMSPLLPTQVNPSAGVRQPPAGPSAGVSSRPPTVISPAHTGAPRPRLAAPMLPPAVRRPPTTLASPRPARQHQLDTVGPAHSLGVRWWWWWWWWCAMI